MWLRSLRGTDGWEGRGGGRFSLCFARTKTSRSVSLWVLAAFEYFLWLPVTLIDHFLDG